MINLNGPILLVDDNPIDLFLNQKLVTISELGSTFKTFPSGKEALAFVLTLTEDTSPFPAYMLLDIQMPVMDGFEFLIQYESQAPEWLKQKLLIFMLSSTADQHDLRRLRENPLVKRVFKKPLEPSVLKQELEKY